MKTRLQTLKRLAAMYGVMEQMRSLELRQAMAAVSEAVQAIESQEEVSRDARSEGRAALEDGDRPSWLMAEAHKELAGWKGQRLSALRLERVQASATARERYSACRLQREQMARVVERLWAGLDRSEERRSQAQADDRFLSRRRWLDAEHADRMNPS